MDDNKQQLNQDSCEFESIMQIVYPFLNSRVLLTAYELDIFTVLGDQSKTSQEVAKTLGAAERSTDRLLNALCAMKLLKKKSSLFSNAPLAAKFLVKGKPDYMAGLMHFVHMWDSWSTLTQSVQKGSSVSDKDIKQQDSQWLKPFIAAMHERASFRAGEVVAMLDLSNVLQVLDVGSGSGGYAIAFMQAKDDIRVRAFDLPEVISLTKDYIQKAGLIARADFATGDFNECDLGGGFDLILLSAIIHSNSVEQCRELIKKAAAALNPQGQLIIQDFIMEEDRTRPEFGALFALNMLVATKAGDTFTYSEVHAWMQEAGLSRIQKMDTKFGSSLIIGRKLKSA